MALAQPRRAKPTANPPTVTAVASNRRKLNSTSLSDGAASEPGVKRVSNEPAVKRPSSSKGNESERAGVAWDWQARKWIAGGLPQNQSDGNSKAKTDPNRFMDDANSVNMNNKPSQRRKQGGWVSELEGISEKEVTKDCGVARIRRDNAGLRGRRRGFHVIDLQGRRRLSRREFFLVRRERNPRRNPSDKAFSLANLESYLEEKGPSSLIKESLGFSPSSHLNYSPKSNTRSRNQKLVFVGDCPAFLSDISANEQPKLLVRTYGSANEVDDNDDSDDTETFHSERSGCGMPWHWPGNNQRAKHDNQMDSAGSCFSVTKRRVGRRNRMGYKYSSERSVSSFDSDTETVPLMTEPEPFHEYSDEFTASSVELDRETPRRHQLDEFQLKRFSRFKDGGRDGISSNKPGESHELVFRKQREAGGTKHRSLSQKYRPKSFKDLIGQNMVAESLSNAILRGKIAPVYLFHGPRGTGKTTAAKIFTAAMNCLSIEELRPCGLCKECTAFNTGQNYDVKEVDAAGNNDVESMRRLLKHVSLPPSGSRYKVFIVDDCHTLNAEAWNALLKSLEEPPSYVVFILITTDLEQLPRTAMSRCQKFMFPRIKDADIVLRLRKLAAQEKVEIELEALQFIASRSDGSFRDAENMLDQLSLLGNRVTLATVQEMVGLIPDGKLAKLLEFALSADTVSTVNTIRDLMESGVEPLALTSQLATLITDILAGKNRVAGCTTMRVRKEEQERLKQALKVLSEAEKQLRSCSDRTTWLTAAFLQFAPNEPCLLPSSSRGTSVTQSPITFLDASEKETLDLDSAGTRQSWGGDEKWDPHSPQQLDYVPSSLQGVGKLEGIVQKQTDSQGHHFSGSFHDNRIYPCDQSPQSGMSAQERKSSACASPGCGKIVQRESSTMSPSTMDNIWRKVLQGSRSTVVKQLLHGEAKLVSLAVTEAFAIARLEFRYPEHKAMAERARTNIANAFQLALGCPVEVEITLSSIPGESNFLCRDIPFVQRSPEHHNRHTNNLVDLDNGLSQERRIRSGSFRKSSSSFRNMAPVVSSPLHHNLEHRRSRQSFEIEGRTYSKRSTDVSVRDLDVHDRRKSKDLAGQAIKSHHHSHATERLRSSSKHVQGRKGPADGNVDNGHVNEYTKGKQEGAVDELNPSVPLEGNGSGNDENYSSDSEGPPDRDAPSALCWKGARANDNKVGRISFSADIAHLWGLTLPDPLHFAFLRAALTCTCWFQTHAALMEAYCDNHSGRSPPT